MSVIVRVLSCLWYVIYIAAVSDLIQRKEITGSNVDVEELLRERWCVASSTAEPTDKQTGHNSHAYRIRCIAFTKQSGQTTADIHRV